MSDGPGGVCAVNAAMGAGLSETLAEQVRAQLAVLDLQAAGLVHRAVDLAELRAQLRSLIGAWRRLLEAHHPTTDGQSRCPRCRSWWGWRQRWPCPVWRAAHTNLAIHQLPAPAAMAAAAARVPAKGPARSLRVQVIPRSVNSPAGHTAPRTGGAPGAASPDPSPPPPGTATPGTSPPPAHHRLAQPAFTRGPDSQARQTPGSPMEFAGRTPGLDAERARIRREGPSAEGRATSRCS